MVRRWCRALEGPAFQLAAIGVALTAMLVATAPAKAIEAAELAVIVNDNDPASVEIGRYYASARALASANVIHVRLPETTPVMPSGAFERLRDEITAATPPTVQAYAIAWTEPYRVGCMSLTSALTFGFARRYCAKGCKPTAPSQLYDAETRQPFTDLGLRPSMMLAVPEVAGAKRLIDRGIRSDSTRPPGTAYLVITPDRNRNTRTTGFAIARQAHQGRLPVRIEHRTGIKNRFDILFYFIGSRRVPFLDTLGFLPGAMADHLTSTGGRLTSNGQMSAVAWLRAGATGSYGTVVEPCNYPQKFPEPALAMKFYLAGETLIEAYWKSVLWPGQGVFIGEPLARPFAAPVAADS